MSFTATKAWLGRCWAVLLVCAPVLAANPVGRAGYLARYDGDGDGRVSLSEYQAYLSRGFAQMDRNRDGRIERNEWPQPGPGELSRDQHQRNLAAAFHRQDVDGDGFLDLPELTAPPR